MILFPVQLLFTLVEGTETSLDCSLPTQVMPLMTILSYC